MRRSVITDAMDINMQVSMIKCFGKSGIFLFKKVTEKYNTHLQFDVKEGAYIVVSVQNTKRYERADNTKFRFVRGRGY